MVHTNGKPPPKKNKKKKKQGPLKPLTESQKSNLKTHSKNHTTKHMNKMTLLLREGKPWRQAHAIAMSMVGK
tara:strand:- start:546 stop:761 length:216 start_codon:yes stop_codon:yes gene_type:complete